MLIFHSLQEMYNVRASGMFGDWAPMSSGTTPSHLFSRTNEQHQQQTQRQQQQQQRQTQQQQQRNLLPSAPADDKPRTHNTPLLLSPLLFSVSLHSLLAIMPTFASIGVHPRVVKKLAGSIGSLCGNTVSLVVPRPDRTGPHVADSVAGCGAGPAQCGRSVGVSDRSRSVCSVCTQSTVVVVGGTH